MNLQNVKNTVLMEYEKNKLVGIKRTIWLGKFLKHIVCDILAMF